MRVNVYAQTVCCILRQAYSDPNTVTDELVQCILQPGLQPGAVDVFLDFISYSMPALIASHCLEAGFSCQVLVAAVYERRRHGRCNCKQLASRLCKPVAQIVETQALIHEACSQTRGLALWC